jgi:hypothetical protein
LKDNKAHNEVDLLKAIHKEQSCGVL